MLFRELLGLLTGSNSMATDITAGISDSPFSIGTAANSQSTGCV